MRCFLWVVSETVFPLDEEGTVDDLYQVHECCSQRCDKYKEGVSEISTDGADDKMPCEDKLRGIGSWSLNNHSFADLDEKTGGLLREVVGDYQEGECVRLFHNREELKQLRVIAEGMEAGHYKFFLVILVDCAEDALQKYGEQAAISNA
ncbi:MAG: hypothetical protein A3G49_06665 [Candidatus Sungbacteria bacterium RIFCSPLOWO2_12_FULL_41_11]|uniref:Uncharacterized protein n=1 Tax=Candidatus Sungbacteria bacterium RIFCSPLOWO2_12_FULL_41_11 TaxID=1802286 RepID=A0A1G2LS90_9BACT|nr:MAG: hypothetical protein UV01_C0003G0111 [Parcubacteria group bacterium GW2011_GWA2_42_14]OGZ98950.1 MAG: hypothetical protein A3D41_04925 [Candidatus Sungbacteria bacterium RIFCSPHIGHO2_02_FULL_41_12b]OHA14500.1 MAG: hypothetical protein A3G49_06665 [Candidatus Sungbacteria bacterium RIFCSPLOWO2_12_FULL_41_11]